MPVSAWLARRRPSKVNGRVTTPIVRAPRPLAIRATTGAPPVPVPPPSPAVTKTMSAPLRTSSISSAWSSAALLADLGVGAGAEPAGELTADVELDVGVAHEQGLRVGVDRDELDALEADLDHPVDGVDTAAADADDLDDGEVVLGCCHDAAFHWVSLASAGSRADESRACLRAVLRRNPQRQVDSNGLVTVRWDDARSAREVRQRGRGRVAASLGEILPCEWTAASPAPPVPPVTRRRDPRSVSG